jgi:hypothetical protein
VSYAVRRRFVGQSSKKPCLADPGRHYVLGFPRFLQLLCLFRQGRKSCGRTYQPPFSSSLHFARSQRATSLRLCVGPAMQVSQALPRGGAESDFSAPRLKNRRLYLFDSNNYKSITSIEIIGVNRIIIDPFIILLGANYLYKVFRDLFGKTLISISKTDWGAMDSHLLAVLPVSTSQLDNL